MKLAAVLTVKNEVDIVGATLDHLCGEGVDIVYAADGMSTDGTRDVLRDRRVVVYDDDSPIHRQPYWSTMLAHRAIEEGADWVLCVDADEFWYAPSGRTIAEELAGYGTGYAKAYARMYHHLDYNMREPDVKPLPKVAFRFCGVVTNGNHDVIGTAAGESLHGLLAIREVQYRGFEHFVRKIEERCATLDPSLPPGEGTHHTQYAGWSKKQLEPVWQAMVDRATVLDPIPVRQRA